MAKKKDISPLSAFEPPTAAPIGADVVVINDKYTYRGTVISYGVRHYSEKKEVYYVLVDRGGLFGRQQWESMNDVFEVE